ncbi:MAG: 3-deoxy-D-manno-octulosonic acid transferase [Deltaproteobacteria bacterium]|nr:3-deoxy-D-manno-octulosonic acid transferase [Deltaproteobacteria bacterium]
MRWVYPLASYLLFLLAFPLLALHRKTRNGLRQRLGLYRPGEVPAGGAPRIWLHGASAGDLLALSPMVPALRARFPDCRIFFTTTTNTGYLMATGRLGKLVDGAFRWPWDLPGATRRAMAGLAPDLLVLEYTEIWPNLLRAAREAGVAVALTNGRFSPARLGQYRLLFRAVGNPLGDVDLLLMREEEEAERALQLGAVPARVRVTGNTKFDALAAQPPLADGGLRAALGLREGEPAWICGSTHEGEEELLLDVFLQLRRDFPALRLVIAPRYIDRAPRVVALADQAGLEAGLRSRGTGQGKAVVVLDTIGELPQVYGLATLVFVGGSFTHRGGQNILEPAGQGRPVLFGPHMDNFRDSVQVLVGRGGIQVNDAVHLYKVMHELLSRPDKLAELGTLASTAVRQVSGASGRNVEAMAELLAARRGRRP